MLPRAWLRFNTRKILRTYHGNFAGKNIAVISPSSPVAYSLLSHLASSGASVYVAGPAIHLSQLRACLSSHPNIEYVTTACDSFESVEQSMDVISKRLQANTSSSAVSGTHIPLHGLVALNPPQPQRLETPNVPKSSPHVPQRVSQRIDEFTAHTSSPEPSDVVDAAGDGDVAFDASTPSATPNGVERIFHYTTVVPFLASSLLLPHLLAGGTAARPAAVVLPATAGALQAPYLRAVQKRLDTGVWPDTIVGVLRAHQLPQYYAALGAYHNGQFSRLAFALGWNFRSSRYNTEQVGTRSWGLGSIEQRDIVIEARATLDFSGGVPLGLPPPRSSGGGVSSTDSSEGAASAAPEGAIVQQQSLSFMNRARVDCTVGGVLDALAGGPVMEVVRPSGAAGSQGLRQRYVNWALGSDESATPSGASAATESTVAESSSVRPNEVNETDVDGGAAGAASADSVAGGASLKSDSDGVHAAGDDGAIRIYGGLVPRTCSRYYLGRDPPSALFAVDAEHFPLWAEVAAEVELDVMPWREDALWNIQDELTENVPFSNPNEEYKGRTLLWAPQ